MKVQGSDREFTPPCLADSDWRSVLKKQLCRSQRLGLQTHRSRGSAPRPAHSLRDTRPELVHVWRVDSARIWRVDSAKPKDSLEEAKEQPTLHRDAERVNFEWACDMGLQTRDQRDCTRRDGRSSHGGGVTAERRESLGSGTITRHSSREGAVTDSRGCSVETVKHRSFCCLS
ncbi:unnamed protein product [Pleuronectes platessa]|uniref:Uncharacterized protein n=1 Tax=Pleuronectes platessa TaxID=8262 RepID=A0A9N7W298_PLEPL|nr:unnamed protein product [Pleuronectes platessa]